MQCNEKRHHSGCLIGSFHDLSGSASSLRQSIFAAGIVGTVGGIALGKVLGTRKGLLEQGFAAVVIAIGAAIAASSI